MTIKEKILTGNDALYGGEHMRVVFHKQVMY